MWLPPFQAFPKMFSKILISNSRFFDRAFLYAFLYVFLIFADITENSNILDSRHSEARGYNITFFNHYCNYLKVKLPNKKEYWRNSEIKIDV
jgi:hypothetical protein